MPTEFKLPLLAEGINSADVAELHVKAGDTVEAGQVLMELETDKAVMELPSPSAGTIAALLVKKGDTVKVGQAILSFGDGGGAATNGATEGKAPADAKASAGATAAAAKASAATEKPATDEQTPKAPATTATSTVPWSNGTTPVAAGPATRRMARELGVDLGKVRGSGSGGRITSEDVARTFAGSSSSGGGGLVIPPLPDFSSFGDVERQPYTRLQKTVANNLSLAWQIIPHVTQHDLADITDIENARKRFVENAGKNASKVTMTAITMKAIVACLQQFPHFNSSYDSQKGELVLKKYYHIGVAVDTPTGLVVPVIRDVDQKTVVQLANELTNVAEKARNGKLTIEDMRGGTFTITNLGGIGGTAFTPIVNYPEVAILGMSRSQKQLQLVNGELKERLMLPFSLSYDHRVVNGADAARFLVRLAGMFADPFRLLVEC
ncbi:MAG: 2-oxo acid dehydrogenase subunit E2 [Planctomycetaceae bacterium]|nr:2-oxo acid dehydrogenase subunit E2 [Planctomycetaceae bacterium]